MDSNYKFHELELIKELTFIEKIIRGLFNIFGYTFGYLSILPDLIKYRNKPNPTIFRCQSEAYAENGEIVYKSLVSENDNHQYSHFNSICEILKSSVEKYPERMISGYRPILSEKSCFHKETNKSTIKLILGDYKWKTYKQFYKEIQKLARYFERNGYGNNGKRMIMFAETSENWLMISLALLEILSPFVTIYTNLPDSSISYAINLTEASSVFVDAKTYDRISKNIDNFNNLEMILISSKLKPNEKEIINSKGKKVNIVELTKILSENEVENKEIICQAKEDDVAFIMFTSGSTGTPKGVIVTHGNITATVSVVEQWREMDFEKKCIYPGFLPLAHILEYVLEINVIKVGGRIGYGNPLTLINKSPMLADGCQGDINLLQPNVLCTVPIIVERLKKAAIDELLTKSRIFQILFQTAYNMKAHFLSMGNDTPILNEFIFKKTLSIFGGSLKIARIGGASLSLEAEEFCLICFGNIKMAYGLTETVCCAAINNTNYFRPGSCGSPTPCSEIKLKSWEEGGYFADGSHPKGEIWISGKCLTKGYYKNDALTNESYITDMKTGKRWFATGDIGEILKDGTIKIIDRKKEIIKLLHGEYVSLAKIENEVMTSKYVEICCVLPNSSMSFLILLIIPKRSSLFELANELKISKFEIPFEMLIQDETLIKVLNLYILDSLKKNLNKFEIPAKICFIRDLWTPENGLITSSFKVRRFAIKKHYEELLV